MFLSNFTYLNMQNTNICCFSWNIVCINIDGVLSGRFWALTFFTRNWRHRIVVWSTIPSSVGKMPKLHTTKMPTKVGERNVLSFFKMLILFGYVFLCLLAWTLAFYCISWYCLLCLPMFNLHFSYFNLVFLLRPIFVARQRLFLFVS